MQKIIDAVKTFISMVMLFFVLVFLSGCAGGIQPVSEETLNEAGEVIQVTTKYVADASVAKEEAVHKTLRARDRAIVQDGKNSGMKMEWVSVEETISVSGQQTITMKRVMPVISFKERGRFDQKLPVEPSVHPGYKMTENIVGKVANATVVGMGINVGKEVLQSALGAAGSKQTINADTVDASDNRTTIGNSGPDAQITTTGTKPSSEVVVVEPMLAEEPGATITTP